MSCKIEGCENDVHATGLCNTHYIRKNRDSVNKPMKALVEQHGVYDECQLSDCNENHYGKGLCKQHYQKWRWYYVKKKLVEYLGGQCCKCDCNELASLDFHHLDKEEKKFGIADKLHTYGYERLLKEAKKCTLMCANCHRSHHFPREKMGEMEKVADNIYAVDKLFE
jgi:hypothetical protein